MENPALNWPWIVARSHEDAEQLSSAGLPAPRWSPTLLDCWGRSAVDTAWLCSRAGSTGQSSCTTVTLHSRATKTHFQEVMDWRGTACRGRSSGATLCPPASHPGLHSSYPTRVAPGLALLAGGNTAASLGTHTHPRLLGSALACVTPQCVIFTRLPDLLAKVVYLFFFN